MGSMHPALFQKRQGVDRRWLTHGLGTPYSGIAQYCINAHNAPLRSIVRARLAEEATLVCCSSSMTSMLIASVLAGWCGGAAGVGTAGCVWRGGGCQGCKHQAVHAAPLLCRDITFWNSV